MIDRFNRSIDLEHIYKKGQ